MIADAALTPEQRKALRHIVANGDDRGIRSKRWAEVKLSLFRIGLLRRRVGDWAWVPAADKEPS